MKMKITISDFKAAAGLIQIQNKQQLFYIL